MWKEVFVKSVGNFESVQEINKVHTFGNSDLKTPLKIPTDKELDTMKRFMIVRNPYARLLSGWLAKRNQWRNNSEVWPKPYTPHNFIRRASSEEFAEFVRALVSTPPEMVNGHFSPIVLSHCFVNEGFSYDFILKLELMDEWYEMFISSLNLYKTVASGWKQDSGNTTTISEDCLFVPHYRTGCENLFASGFVHRWKGVSEIQQSCAFHKQEQGRKKDTLSGQHFTHSETRLSEFYNNKETVMLVSKYFALDFQKLHYPVWDWNENSYCLV